MDCARVVYVCYELSRAVAQGALPSLAEDVMARIQASEAPSDHSV